jgi:hypothetical protein
VCETIEPKPPPDLAGGGAALALLADAAVAAFGVSVFLLSVATLAAAPATFSAVAR